MNPVRHRPPSLRFLLYIEWAILAILAVAECLGIWFVRRSGTTLLNLICLAVFGIMGLELPGKRMAEKILYTGAELGLLVFSGAVGSIRLFPLLCIILVMRNCFIFEEKKRLAVTVVAYSLCLAIQTQRFQNMLSVRPLMRLKQLLDPEQIVLLWLTFAVLFGLVLLFLQLMVDAVLSEQKSREKLAIAHARLREYALRVEDVATLQERNRIAREIHDALGHSLTAFNLHLTAALRLLPTNSQEATALLTEARELGAKALHDVRQSVATLRSDPLAGKSLQEAIASLVEEFQRSTGITPEVAIDLPVNLPEAVKTATYRILQEALTNICKYAEATLVQITIQLQVNPDTFLQLTVRDNGKGFHLEQNTTGFGLRGMQERTKALRGHIRIQTAPGKGCAIAVLLPLPEALSRSAEK